MMTLRLVVGLPAVLLPFALVLAWEHHRPALLPLAGAYAVVLAAAWLLTQAEKVKKGKR